MFALLPAQVNANLAKAHLYFETEVIKAIKCYLRQIINGYFLHIDVTLNW